MGQNKNFEITICSYSLAFSEQFVLYLKVLAILVPEIYCPHRFLRTQPQNLPFPAMHSAKFCDFLFQNSKSRFESEIMLY